MSSLLRIPILLLLGADVERVLWNTLKLAVKRKKAKSLASLKRRAWKLLSEVVRRQWASVDGYVVCYTCGNAANWKEMQAGHAIPGRTGAVLLDEDIIRPQDEKCNIWGRGMHHIFAGKLIRENGVDWWDRKLSESRSVVKWTRSDLEAKIEKYRARLQALDSPAR